MFNQKRTLIQLFCLDGLFLEKVETNSDEVVLRVYSPRHSAVCPWCNRFTKRIMKKGVRNIKHGFCDNRLVILRITLRSFRCSQCGSFREHVPGIDRRQTTARFRALVIPKIRDRSFSAVAKDFGLSASSLIRSARELRQSIATPWPTVPFSLGIDEHSFSGRDLMITLTDISHHNLLDLLKNDYNVTLRNWLQNMPEKAKNLIQAVCIDMRSSYRSVVEQELPGIPIVIDKFHVIQHLNWHLQQLRLLYTNQTYPLPKQLLEKNREDLQASERAWLQTIFRRYPAIAEFWRIKEIMRRLYRLRDSNKATEQFDALLDGLRGDDRPRWAELYRTLKRWRTYILNYFYAGRITNAYTEGVHTRIKLLKRISYGFRNKTNYIAKMTLAFLPLLTILEVLKHHPV
jgi:transposase